MSDLAMLLMQWPLRSYLEPLPLPEAVAMPDPVMLSPAPPAVAKRDDDQDEKRKKGRR